MKKREKLASKNRIGLKEVTREVAHRTGLSMADADEATRAVFNTIKQNLYNQTVVEIYTFGTFSVYQYKGKIAHVPTGDKVYLQPRLFPKFRYSLLFKDQIRRKKIDAVKQMKFSGRLDVDLDDDHDDYEEDE